MSAGNELGASLRALERLCAELGYESDAEGIDASDSPVRVSGPNSILGSLSAEDEALVGAIRRSLASVAAAISRQGRSEARASAVIAALDGTELVMRGELFRGQAEQLPGLLPGFVFLVAMAVVGQDEALELSRRAARLVEGASGG